MPRVPTLSLLAAVASLALASGTRGQSSGGPYAIPAQVVAAGGRRSSGGAFALEGTVGQHAVGPVASGGAFELSPGFHRRGAIVDGVFANGFEDD